MGQLATLVAWSAKPHVNREIDSWTVRSYATFTMSQVQGSFREMTTNPFQNTVSRVARLAVSLAEQEASALAFALQTGAIDLETGVLTLRDKTGLREQKAIEISALMNDWNGLEGTGGELAAALLSARAVFNQARELDTEMELVWTGPPDFPEVKTRTNLNVLLELISSAQREVVIVGYSITRFAEMIFRVLGEVRERGVRVVIITNDMEQHVPIITRYWPSGKPMPELYTRPPTEDDEKSALHAKLAIVDSDRMLITSANLTYHGLEGNLEIGLLVKGDIARQTVNIFNALISRGVILPFQQSR